MFQQIREFYYVKRLRLSYVDLLFGIWDMSLHVVQCALCDSFLENKIFQLMAIAVVFDSCSDFAEAIQKHFVICTVLFVVP